MGKNLTISGLMKNESIEMMAKKKRISSRLKKFSHFRRYEFNK